MIKRNLYEASHQLFRRSPDERFPTLESLVNYCNLERQRSLTQWYAPEALRPQAKDGRLMLGTNGDTRIMTEWSFSQLCRIAQVDKGTLNRLSADTATTVLTETLPKHGKPLQMFGTHETLRSVHGVTYTRLCNADVLETVLQTADGFVAPQEGVTGGNGLYCGEQDMFCFLIDPLGWVEIEGEAFAPGFFVWNSEVGRRSVGLQTFWFQAVCQNHIVWDAVQVCELTRKHTAGVSEALEDISVMLSLLVRERDRRRDSFARVISKAMQEELGKSPDESADLLQEMGYSRKLAEAVVAEVSAAGKLTVFSVVDALTRRSQKLRFAGERVEQDAKASRLLALAA